MMSKPSDIIAIALAEVGYREKASNAFLDDKTANAGSANWTKYARDLAKAGYYQAGKNGYAWCDVFVDWCFFKAYGSVDGQKIQCQTGPYGAGCIYSAQYYQQKGRYDKTPKVGDQVFFQSGGTIGHTGVVVDVTATTITTVEGNSGDQVKKNTYSRSSSYIAGYGHPLYSNTDDDPPKEPEDETPPAAPATGSCEVALPLLKRGDTGTAVKNAQTLLIAKGYPCGGRYSGGRENPDGDYGPTTENSVKNFQSIKKLQADGKIGGDTWKTLLTG